MGMSIEDCVKELLLNKEDDTYVLGNETIDFAIDRLHEYQMMQAAYENRLKPYVVDMLEDLKKEMNPIKECEHQIYGKEHWNFVGKCQDVIQQKINALQEHPDGEIQF